MTRQQASSCFSGHHYGLKKNVVRQQAGSKVKISVLSRPRKKGESDLQRIRRLNAILREAAKERLLSSHSTL